MNLNPEMRRRRFLQGALGTAVVAALGDLSQLFVLGGGGAVADVATDEEEAIRVAYAAPQIVLPETIGQKYWALDRQMVPDRDDTATVQLMLDRAGTLGRATMPRDSVWRVKRDLLLSGGTLDLNGGSLEIVVGAKPLLLKPRPTIAPWDGPGGMAHVGMHSPKTTLAGGKPLTSAQVDRKLGTLRRYFAVRSDFTTRAPTPDLELGQGWIGGDMRLGNTAHMFQTWQTGPRG